MSENIDSGLLFLKWWKAKSDYFNKGDIREIVDLVKKYPIPQDNRALVANILSGEAVVNRNSEKVRSHEPRAFYEECLQKEYMNFQSNLISQATLSLQILVNYSTFDEGRKELLRKELPNIKSRLINDFANKYYSGICETAKRTLYRKYSEYDWPTVEAYFNTKDSEGDS